MVDFNARLRRLEEAFDRRPDPEVMKRLARFRDDPAGFNREVLGRELWSKQVEICDAIVRNPITVVPAGRACGKSFLLAGVVLWWAYTRPMSLAITTGPDHRQVCSVLFKEIRRAVRNSLKPLRYARLTQGYASPQRLTIEEGTDWGVLGFAAGTEEGFSGQHAGELLVIVDEASGITDPIWEAIHGLAAARLVVAGNPIKFGCRFRELHDLAESGSPNITTIPISSLESPHAEMETSPVGMASASFLRQMREIHGEDSPWWRSNILGFFPGQESVRFVQPAWLDACINPAILTNDLWLDYPAGTPTMAVDIGGGVGADRSVILVRNRKQLLEIFASEWHGVLDDARSRLEPEVVRLCRKWGVTGDHVLYDKGGIGRSFGSYLAAHEIHNSTGYFGNGSGGPFYKNRRTANAYALMKRLDPKRDNHVPFYCGGVAEWPALRREIAELRTPSTEMEEGAFKQALESKESLSARLGHSSDCLDAMLISFSYSE